MISIKLSHWHVYVITLIIIVLGFIMTTAPGPTDEPTIAKSVGYALFLIFLMVQVIVVAIMADIVEKWKRKEEKNA